jgi:cobalt-precorrin-5B (C1)-methyltransferase
VRSPFFFFWKRKRIKKKTLFARLCLAHGIFMDKFITKGGQKLRLGCTTGSCAAAAAKAAACALLTGECPDRVEVLTPKGLTLALPVAEVRIEAGTAFCTVIKDDSDDPDVTKGAAITAEVSLTEAPGISIDGGKGVGRVTRPGLDQPVGAAAINSTPRRMIRENLEKLCEQEGCRGGLSVMISVPEGETLARRTFNPRLGIEGGISILGTAGIVEPMSEQALLDTIRVELRQRRVSGADFVLLAPGNYGSDFVRDGLGIDPELAVQCSNFIGEAAGMCRDLGFRGLLLVGHVGKLVKLAGGMPNTHSRYGDCRMEILAAHAAAAGLAPEKTGQILQCVACDEALRLCGELRTETMARVTERAAEHLSRWAEGLEIGVTIFSKVSGVLGQTANVPYLLEKMIKT